MKNLLTTFFAIILSITSLNSFAQTQVYSISTGELLFQWGEISFTDEYQKDNPLEEQLNSPMRFTCFFHLSQNIHIDFNDRFGIYSGLAVRNVGLTSNERLIKDDGTLQNYKILRRSYNLGVPLAIKLGSFDNHAYIFVGGEIELQFHYKEKYWDSHNRSGSKTKYTEWFGDQTNRFVTAGFLGFQFPGGYNLKFKYYFTDFLNHDYKDANNSIRDLRRYASSNIMYVSVSRQFRTERIFKKKRTTEPSPSTETAYR